MFIFIINMKLDFSCWLFGSFSLKHVASLINLRGKMSTFVETFYVCQSNYLVNSVMHVCVITFQTIVYK